MSNNRNRSRGSKKEERQSQNIIVNTVENNNENHLMKRKLVKKIHIGVQPLENY